MPAPRRIPGRPQRQSNLIDGKTAETGQLIEPATLSGQSGAFLSHPVTQALACGLNGSLPAFPLADFGVGRLQKGPESFDISGKGSKTCHVRVERVFQGGDIAPGGLFPADAIILANLAQKIGERCRIRYGFVRAGAVQLGECGRGDLARLLCQFDFRSRGGEFFGKPRMAFRVGLLTLLPLAQGELPAGRASLEERLWLGGYPALHASHRAPEPAHWFGAYFATYVERDVRQLLNVGNLATFQRFVAMCAARSGQLLNLNGLASDCGISQPTARQWLAVLQASHLVVLLPPYHRNFGKRLVKTPKLYFVDTGLLCWLLRIASPQDLQVHAARGAVFETWVVGETLKHRHNLGLPADLHFWRDNHGLEMDLVVEQQGRIHGVECKSGQTYSPDWLGAARRWRDAAGDEAAPPVLVYGGSASFDRDDHVVLSWQDLGRTA